MKKLKLYLYIAAFVLLAGLVVSVNIFRNRFLEERDRADRLLSNQEVMLNEAASYKKLYLTQQELTTLRDNRIDSLSELLRIKPKQITRYVDRWHYSVDTVVQIDTLRVLPDQVTWPFIDQTECFLFEGNVKLFPEVVMEVNRREYLNQSTEIAYVERSKRFMGFRYGPWQGKVHIFNECGTDEIREIEVIKKARN